MAESDPLIDRTEEAGSGIRAARAANLFDLRRIIGGVFLVWGVVLTILGITESDAEIAKAADVNINLWAGLGMMVFAGLFLLWAFVRPLGEELRADGEGEPSSHERSRRSRSDRAGGGGEGDAGGQ